MKIRNGYVSNSSSSSFLVPYDAKERYGVNCVKLTSEIVKCIRRNLTDYDGRHVELPEGDDWWLTEMVSDCCNESYGKLCDDSSVEYLCGHDAPYGWYDNEENYIVLHGGDKESSYYLAVGDLVGDCKERNIGMLPDVLKMKSSIESILCSKALNKTQKIDAIKLYLGKI